MYPYLSLYHDCMVPDDNILPKAEIYYVQYLCVQFDATLPHEDIPVTSLKSRNNTIPIPWKSTDIRYDQFE